MTAPTGEDSAETKRSDLIEAWKKTVDVQQHFNDIEWRIRGLALTVMTFSLGAAGLAAKDGAQFWHVSLALVVLLVGGVLWTAFFVVDKIWYHPLLIGSVKHGESVERLLGPEIFGLTRAISKESPYKVSPLVFRVSLARRGEINKYVRKEEEAGRPAPNREKRKKYAKTLPAELHSDDKLRVFYALGGVALIVAALAFQAQAWGSEKPESPAEKIEIHLDLTNPPPSNVPSPDPQPSPENAPRPSPAGDPTPSPSEN